ncbi:MAG: hypothetical protein GY913_03300 [Proteobacteria bacterium]|nr:hypothetical protein [Pseudomonadota bacterium]MCP4915927.1 hypothetical protein [Pseudomonadota bacterium]
MVLLYGEARARDDRAVMSKARQALTANQSGDLLADMFDTGDLTWSRLVDRTDLAAALLARSLQPQLSADKHDEPQARALELDAYHGLVHHVVAARGL